MSGLSSAASAGRDGSLRLQTPDAETLVFNGAASGPAADLALRDWGVCAELLRGGDVAFADSYIEGRWESGDLAALLQLAAVNERALEQAIHGRWWMRALLSLRHALNANTRRGSRRNIEAHYDLGNEFFRLWLDPGMTYSAAVFAGDSHLSLEQPQQVKYERIPGAAGGEAGRSHPRERLRLGRVRRARRREPGLPGTRNHPLAEPARLVRYFGVGNESWGCGGNMRPEYYADQFRRYNTFVKNYGGNRVYRIACGANGGDFNWTEVLMQQVGPRMNGLSLHYYTIATGNWGRKGSATKFDEDLWHSTLRRTLEMDDLIAKHSAIMDKHDARKRVGLVVDEWGTWYDVEPGTNPGFLYQQNTLRDALVAALNFHIFHKHADRVVMANIAQTINVLQAMVLTDNEKMLRTPTYWVFEMFKVHQAATNLSFELQTPDYEVGSNRMPTISASATRAASGALHLSMENAHPTYGANLTCKLAGVAAASVSGRILTTAATNAHNTFAEPEAIKPVAFAGAKLEGESLRVELPPKSVVVLELK